MISKDTMEMLEKACRHMTRMENDPEYRKEIEKRLYAGAPKESIERIRQEGIKNGSITVSKRNQED